jgi:hypothetical protein
MNFRVEPFIPIHSSPTPPDKAGLIKAHKEAMPSGPK